MCAVIQLSIFKSMVLRIKISLITHIIIVVEVIPVLPQSQTADKPWNLEEEPLNNH